MSQPALQASIEAVLQENAKLKAELKRVTASEKYSYAAGDVQLEHLQAGMPEYGTTAQHALRVVSDQQQLDCRVGLNTASYVTVAFEAEELQAANQGLLVNIADQTVYPQSFQMHNDLVNAIAKLWNCPDNDDFLQSGVHAGACTVGSTEACLLAGLCMKFRWRAWYAQKHNLSAAEVRAVCPNLVISTCYQACWEKFFKYMDVEAKFAVPSKTTFGVTPELVRAQVDEKTIGVVCIMGNHYGGQYDPVWDIDAELQKLNKEKGWQVGIHVDGASGGFIAPFQKELPPWDFRLPSVLSISASGHKFGQSCCGTGWVIWRQREGLSEHVAIHVTYLGGSADSYTLNFSRPASGIYVQYYKFLRLGAEGYSDLERNMMANAKLLRDGLKAMTHNGKPRFEMLDAGDTGCLPVVTACLNPELGLNYNDIDLQHRLSEEQWYVGGYKMNFNDPVTEESRPLFSDAEATQTMFRVVVKANVTRLMIEHLIGCFQNALADLDLRGRKVPMLTKSGTRGLRQTHKGELVRCHSEMIRHHAGAC